MKKEKPLLRFEFVGMLFALAIGQVAIEIVKLLNSNCPLEEWFYSLSHLILAASIITMSWIGWQSSKSLGNSISIDSVFSLPFLVLLMDISLVIVYFITANGNEKLLIDKSGFQEPDGYNETLWVSAIFFIYVIWDVVTKMIKIKYKELREEGKVKIYKVKYKFTSKYYKRTLTSLFCLGISVYFFKMYGYKPINGYQALLLDINLFLLFIQFRGMKQTFEKSYALREDQIPDQVIEDSKLEFNGKKSRYKVINIEDSTSSLKTKKFIFRFLPIITIIVLELVNHYYFD